MSKAVSFKVAEAPDGYLTDGAKPIDFTITENGKKNRGLNRKSPFYL